MKEKSLAWNYYTANADGKTLKCNYCFKSYGQHATRLLEHLVEKCKKIPPDIRNTIKKQHNSGYKLPKSCNRTTRPTRATSPSPTEPQCPTERTETEAQCPTSPSRTSSSISSSTIIPATFYDSMSTEEKEKLNQMLSKAIIVTGCPFNMLEHHLWQEFFKQIRPSYQLPTRKEIGGGFLEKHYTDFVGEITVGIEGAPVLHLQLDGWSNIRHEPIINFIINKPEPLFVKFIETKEDSHTSVYLKNEIVKILETYGPDKFLGIIGDNASNIQRAFELVKMEYPHVIPLRCIAHTMNLICSDLIQLPCLKTFLLNDVNGIITHIKNSHVLQAILKNHNSKVSLKIYCKTRWGSMAMCLESLIANKHALQSCAIDPAAKVMNVQYKNNILSENFWQNVESSLNVLKPIARTIKYLEGDQLHAHEVVKIINKLYDEVLDNIEKCSFLKQDCKTFKKKFLERKKNLINPIHLAACFLNPVDRGESLNNDDVIEAMEFIYDLSKLKFTSPDIRRNSCDNSRSNNICVEMANYRSKEGFFKKSFLWDQVETISPSLWWKSMCGNTCLSQIAYMILTLPISSAATERSFSTFSVIHSKKRNRLGTTKASKVTYIAHNWKLINKTAVEDDSLKLRKKKSQVQMVQENSVTRVEMETADDPDDPPIAPEYLVNNIEEEVEEESISSVYETSSSSDYDEISLHDEDEDSDVDQDNMNIDQDGNGSDGITVATDIDIYSINSIDID